MTLIVLSLGSASPVFAQECGESAIVNSSKISVTTKLALDFIKSIIGGIKGEAELIRERNSVFAQFPNGQQGIIVYTMYRDQCLMIKASTTMSDGEKMDRIEKLQDRLLSRVNGPQPVATTKEKNSSSGSRHLRSNLSRYANSGLPARNLLVLVGTTPLTQPNPKDFIEEETGWLRQQPFYITEKNKHFVIVASAPDEAAGKLELKTSNRNILNMISRSMHPMGRTGIMGL